MSSKPRKDKSRNKSSFVGAGDEANRHIVLAGKRKIVGVDDVTDEEEYNKVEDMTPFAVDVELLRDFRSHPARNLQKLISKTLRHRFSFPTRCQRGISVPARWAPKAPGGRSPGT